MQKRTSIIYPQIKVKRKLPVNLNEKDGDLFKQSIIHTLKEVMLFEYRNVCVTPEGIVFKGLYLDKELFIFPKHKKMYNKFYLLSSLIKRKKINLSENETYLLIFDYWSNSIFHWMCDALPRLEAIKEKAKNCILLIPENYEYSYIWDSLKAFEVKGVYKIPSNSYVSCLKLISPNQITNSGFINPENFIRLRESILNYYKPLFKNIDFSPNIYISRNKAKYRKVLNEYEIIPLFKKYNFKIVYFEDMSFIEQVECCYYAKNIISIHGANLTNCVFIKSGSNVLEFRKENDSENNYFYEITDSVGANYFYQNCVTIDNIPGKNFFDLKVNVTLLEKNINNMLSYEN